jgi:8-oxo-dGTP pyrophosphatase MutT (NUDIX family)
MLLIKNLRDELERFLQHPGRRAAGVAEIAHQAGTLPYRITDQGHEVLLVTSKRTGRWVLPKGWPAAGESLVQSAARETYEEAGVMGAIEPVELGRFLTTKIRMGSRASFVVVIYPLRVELELATWPERLDRRRLWFSLAQARSIVAVEQRGVLRALERSVQPVPGDRILGGSGKSRRALPARN